MHVHDSTTLDTESSIVKARFELCRGHLRLRCERAHYVGLTSPKSPTRLRRDNGVIAHSPGLEPGVADRGTVPPAGWVSLGLPTVPSFPPAGFEARQLENPTVGLLDRIARALSAHISEFFIKPKAGESRPRPLPGGRRRADNPAREKASGIELTVRLSGPQFVCPSVPPVIASVEYLQSTAIRGRLVVSIR
jgi:hypothetical protein